MATSRKPPSPPNFADSRSADSVRRQFIEAPMDAARLAALGTGLEVAAFLNMLPDAFAASQQRELARVRTSSDENDPRIAALQASIEQAETLRTMARRGNARLERATVIFRDQENAFHGFVSNIELEPLEGLTVRLTGARAAGEALSATTEADGYFRIPLGTKREPPSRPAQTGVSQRLSNLVDRLSEKPTNPEQPTPGGTAEEGVTQVEILRKTRVVHRDPVPVSIKSGRLYREYVLGDEGDRPERDSPPAKKTAARKK